MGYATLKGGRGIGLDSTATTKAALGFTFEQDFG